MSVIDLTIFNSLKEATGAEFTGELIHAFLEDAPLQIQHLRDALAANDAESFRRAAHTLKSNAATFGAMELSALARELEMMGRDNNLEVGTRLEVMQDAFDQAKSQLKELR
jgi:HPt (histidine-containing phosphotransfer) domain-containing protein